MTTDAKKARVIDIFDPEDMRDPNPIYAEMRSKCPVAHSDKHGGFWAVSRYEDVKHVAENFAVFSSAQTNALREHALPKMIPIDMDPPEHRGYRKLLSEKVTREAVTSSHGISKATAQALIEGFKDDGEADVSVQFTQPFPMSPIFQIVGIGMDDVMNIFAPTRIAVEERATNPEKAAAAAGEMWEFSLAIARRAQENPPPNTLLNDLVKAQFRGAPLTTEEIARYMLILLFGGLDTTTNSLSFAIHHMATRPDLRKKLLDDDAFAYAADEFVRLATPVQGLRRTCTRDTEIAGQKLSAGDRVLMLFGAANSDSSVFEAPTEFRFGRDTSKHVGFGAGAHTCLGQHLARVLIENALREFLTAIPEYELAPGYKLQVNASEVRGFSSLPIVF